MTVIEVNNPSAMIKGYLQRYMLEVRAGLFVGNLPRLVRESVWINIVTHMKFGDAIMIASAQTEAGYIIFTHGENRRIPVDYCGVWLVEYQKHFAADQPER